MADLRIFSVVCCLVIISVIWSGSEVEARYLPTRGSNDRLDKLKDMLKELVENEIEVEEYQADAPPRWHPDRKLFYKREIPAQ